MKRTRSSSPTSTRSIRARTSRAPRSIGSRAIRSATSSVPTLSQRWMQRRHVCSQPRHAAYLCSDGAQTHLRRLENICDRASACAHSKSMKLLTLSLIALLGAACGDGDDIDSDEEARRAYFGLDASIEK